MTDYAIGIFIEDPMADRVSIPVDTWSNRLGLATPLVIVGEGGASFSGYGAVRTLAKDARKAISAPPGSGQDTSYAVAVNAMIEKRSALLSPLNTELGVTGSVVIPGAVLKSQVPVNRVVRVYDLDSGELVGSAFSDGSGQFSISGIANGDYFITAHDFGTQQNMSIIQNVTV